MGTGQAAGARVLRTTNTRDALVAELRTQILSGSLAPGTDLTENGLAATFGVARPTVRSALQELLARNLAHRGSGRSLVVPALTVDDVRDLFFVRTPLEVAAVRRIVRERPDLAPAERALGELTGLPNDAGWAARVEAHTAFHVALIDCAGSSRLSRLYPALQEEMQLCLAHLSASYPAPQDLADEHRTLFEAIVAGNETGAVTEMRAHLDRALHGLTGNA